ncbi:hypothetical protein A0J61_05328 [Choanephora cucurbitarum]|uniref:Uncharacterized protein n=1 Tax=Choanephora cucurbitarum TaxID=101091 RepID=A0A1C7NCA9_9FUNG|nr:hypothetical protein A0J61_05328 [Choanephora cucurbitarum]
MPDYVIIDGHECLELSSVLERKLTDIAPIVVLQMSFSLVHRFEANRSAKLFHRFAKCSTCETTMNTPQKGISQSPIHICEHNEV